MYEHRSPQNRKQARRNLKRIMPLALTRADELEAAGEAISGAASLDLGAAMPPQIRIRNLVGVHLYSLGPGIHHADIELTGMPDGCPNILGTPVAAPRANQHEAQEWAINRLVHVILSERRCPDLDVPPMAFVPFEIDGMTFSVPRAHIQAASEVGYFEESQAAAHIQRIRRLMGGRLTPRGFNMLSAHDVEFLNISMVSMLLAGTPRYPRRRPAAPG